ncbi:hypothetical protein RF11_03023 [Thelohanellus kitauei]|uniref:Uncharacterized protein n=1 Tax=Thelohanellus kitauei TaxID=669202 RepID=A0A0C2MLT6_THEKT|nr:hypothetical protein RF11_03023 [Thelohanellus kitauei]
MLHVQIGVRVVKKIVLEYFTSQRPLPMSTNESNWQNLLGPEIFFAPCYYFNRLGYTRNYERVYKIPLKLRFVHFYLYSTSMLIVLFHHIPESSILDNIVSRII